MPYFNYCSPEWGNVGKGLTDKLQKLQNRAARIVTFSSYENHPSDLLIELGWEKLELQRLKQLAVLMYKVHNFYLSPPYFCRIFTNVSSIHSYNLRNSQSNCYIPRPRTESAKGSLHYRLSVLWKRIPLEIRQRPNLNHFKINFIQWERFFVTILLSEN